MTVMGARTRMLCTAKVCEVPGSHRAAIWEDCLRVTVIHRNHPNLDVIHVDTCTCGIVNCLILSGPSMSEFN